MYAWSGSVLECRICGVIYRSRQHWFGNETPEATAVVHTEISHIWPGVRTLQGKAGLFEEGHIYDIRFQFEWTHGKLHPSISQMIWLEYGTKGFPV